MILCSRACFVFIPSACGAVYIIFTAIIRCKTCLGVCSATTNPNMSSLICVLPLSTNLVSTLGMMWYCTICSNHFPACKGCPADTDQRRISWQVVMLPESSRGWKRVQMLHILLCSSLFYGMHSPYPCLLLRVSRSQVSPVTAHVPELCSHQDWNWSGHWEVSFTFLQNFLASLDTAWNNAP